FRILGIMVLGVDWLDAEVTDQADQQQADHDVHGDGVGLCRVHTGVDLGGADVVHQYGPGNAGRRPGSQDAAVDGAHVHGAEDVLQVGGDGGKAAAVHADDDAVAYYVQEHAADRCRTRHQRIQRHAEDEEDDVGVLAA